MTSSAVSGSAIVRLPSPQEPLSDSPDELSFDNLAFLPFDRQLEALNKTLVDSYIENAAKAHQTVLSSFHSSQANKRKEAPDQEAAPPSKRQDLSKKEFLALNTELLKDEAEEEELSKNELLALNTELLKDEAEEEELSKNKL